MKYESTDPFVSKTTREGKSVLNMLIWTALLIKFLTLINFPPTREVRRKYPDSITIYNHCETKTDACVLEEWFEFSVPPGVCLPIGQVQSCGCRISVEFVHEMIFALVARNFNDSVRLERLARCIQYVSVGQEMNKREASIVCLTWESTIGQVQPSRFGSLYSPE